MTFDQFHKNKERYQNTAFKRYILVKTGIRQVEVLRVVDVRDKAIKVALASKPALYTGDPTFWIPWAALALKDDNMDLLDLVLFTPWYLELMGDPIQGKQMKQNLNIQY